MRPYAATESEAQDRRARSQNQTAKLTKGVVTLTELVIKYHR
jgi:hypothetical protein